MRVLLVEDEAEVRDRIVTEVEETGLEVELTLARSLASALECLEQGFDLIICDLRIPSVDDGIDADKRHGYAAYARIRENAPGVPVVFLTGYASFPEMSDALSQAPTVDLFGLGDEEPLVSLLSKDAIRGIFARLASFGDALSRLDSVRITTGEPGQPLPAMVRRALQVYAHQRGASEVCVELLTGLSGSTVLRATLRNEAHHVVCRVFAKIGDHGKVLDERKRYGRHVAGVLDLHRFAPAAGDVIYNLRQSAAAFYSLADGYDSSAFDRMRLGHSVEEVLPRMRNALTPWHSSGQAVSWNLGALRRVYASDERLTVKGVDVGAFREFEARDVTLRCCVQHGDLHGGNVLFDGRGEPLLIDFGDVGVHPSVLDPLVLELSIVFHQDSPWKGSGWPTVEQAERWWDLEYYLVNCPVPSWVAACREWALSIESASVPVVVYVHAVRQLKYSDVPREIAFAYARGAIAQLS